MSQLPAFKRIIAEDYNSKDRELVSKLASSINIAFDNIMDAFANNISIADNLTIGQRSLTTTVDTNGKPLVGLTIASGLASKCTGMSVIKATNNTNSTIIPTSTPFITFIDNSGQISISNISGLQANNNYTLQIILWA